MNNRENVFMTDQEIRKFLLKSGAKLENDDDPTKQYWSINGKIFTILKNDTVPDDATEDNCFGGWGWNS